MPRSSSASPVPSLLPSSGDRAATGQVVDFQDGRYYRIDDAGRMPPFFVNLVSASDLWMFISSNGALTAGRGDADSALFPYQTVDRIHDSAGVIGPVTRMQVETPSGPEAWEPFAPHTDRLHAVTRRLYKSVEGDRIWFEEVHPGLKLAFRYGWATADDHGFVRRCELENLSPHPRRLRLLDGLRNLLAPGVTQRLQSASSNLTDAYKTAELLPGSSLAVYALAAAIVDQPKAVESLRATVAWSEGLPGANVLLSDRALDDFDAGALPPTEHRRRGLRCSYHLCADLTLAPRARQDWLIVCDTGLGQAEVARRRQRLAAGELATEVAAGTAAATRRLRALVGSADGLQAGGDETTTVHHFANVLFNLLRGGIFADNHQVPGRDFAACLRGHNRAAAERHAAWLASLPDTLTRAELVRAAATRGDADLERLAAEYLPLTFSRRHGDPSRPWNRFRIRVRDEGGNRLLAYEGNWRDIFQNWEALCVSYPGFLDAVIAKFLNASTADGYNPYRITQSGIDWEAPEPEDPWASIGYWGDHQTIYLLKLLEWSARFSPDDLPARLRAACYAYARVPYRIASYDEMRRDPRATITFDHPLHRALVTRAAAEGADARLWSATDGRVLHVNLTEKLLVLALARLVNFIPGGGIWMNTQRPEWNDANNALVGFGVSHVTLCYLRRYLAHVREVLLPALGSEPVAVSAAVADLACAVSAALAEVRPSLEDVTTDASARRALVDSLASAGTHYRERLYADGPGAPRPVDPAEIRQLFDVALEFVDRTIRANRRDDGLWHAYNQLEFADDPAVLRLHYLQAMLEGQVAVLSAGLLKPAEVVALLEALRRSPLYRADQHSYVLYPDRELPGFLERNQIPAAAWQGCPLFAALEAAGDTRLVLTDAAGVRRFHPDLVTGAALEERLERLAADPKWAGAVAVGADRVRAAYEQVFRHRAFTGRSGSMFGFEGLGCIYWHMVAKLLLAAQENLQAAVAAGAPEAARLAELYYELRGGLGFNKTPAEYGAFPTDPYSHTPGHSGAQQPGMTGQVKEEILTRWGELGVEVHGGRIAFRPAFLRAGEFMPEPAEFHFVDPTGRERGLPLPAGSLAFTFCGTPVLYRRTADEAAITVTDAAGSARRITGRELDADASRRLLARDGSLARIEVELGRDFRPQP